MTRPEGTGPRGDWKVWLAGLTVLTISEKRALKLKGEEPRLAGARLRSGGWVPTGISPAPWAFRAMLRTIPCCAPVVTIWSEPKASKVKPRRTRVDLATTVRPELFTVRSKEPLRRKLSAPV